ncbi:MAG: ornithine carbamoyltransferase [Verrucomicrobiota bacterium]|jgi:ornithine carbamoyltransferase|nr:ornithine carbamoyltransferase [Verrucomicrobiota bacterium]|tara:strand:- start:2086 stop:2991 length:906 start_codon:yes stop_codon:yes gene_type:complete
MKNFLSIEACSRAEIEELVESSISLKEARNRRDFSSKPLSDQCWGIIFSKASTRTRISFEVGIRELGGSAMFLSPRDLQLGRGEPIKDTARVMGRMLHGAVIRNDSQIEVEQFAELSDIPTINALTDQEHPCQIIADLLTVRETLGSWEGKKVVFLGDADCNVAHSWVWAAKHLGFELVLSGPPQICSPVDYLKGLDCSNVSFLEDPVAAVADANVLYTDVWVSMGMEDEAARREGAFTDYQINEKIINLADPNVMVMHCLPAYRDKEISESAFEANAGTIFSQAENRLHAQKAIMRDLAT